MSIQKNLITLCFAAVFTLGLAACGGGGDDAPATGMAEPMEPMEPTAAEPTAAEQLATAQAAVAQTQTIVDALPAASSPADRAAAYSSLAAAHAALAEASGIPENEIALLKTEIARLQRVIDEAAMDAQTEADRIAGEMTAEEARIAALVAGTASAETKRKAIAEEAKQLAVNNAGLGGIQDDLTEGKWTLGISRDRMATKIEITDPALAGDDDLKFMQAMDLGNGRTMHVRTMEADPDGNVVTEVVIVATDIQAPVATAFAKVAEQGLDVRQDRDMSDADNPNDALTIAAGDADVNLPKIMAARFTAGTEATLMFPINDAETNDKDEAFETAGTYNGAMGTYRCNALDAKCTVDINAMGKISGIGPGWIFTPAKGATSDVPDADYLNYGFWLQKTADADGAVTYDEVETFAGSSLAEPSGSVANVDGSATYEGGATGVYVHSEVNSDGSRVATTAGQFAADASLTATFGQVDVSDTDMRGTIAPNLLYTVTGSISNFALEHGEANTWAVNLQAKIDGVGGSEVGTASGSANGGGMAGTFTATFYGSTVETGTPPINPQPSSVVGEFNANFSNGSAVGAFGARK